MLRREVHTSRILCIYILWMYFKSIRNMINFINNVGKLKIYQVQRPCSCHQITNIVPHQMWQNGRVGSIGSAGQTGHGSKWVNQVGGRVDPYFSNKFFNFIIYLFIYFYNYKNKSMITYLERMNKIN